MKFSKNTVKYSDNWVKFQAETHWKISNPIPYQNQRCARILTNLIAAVHELICVFATWKILKLQKLNRKLNLIIKSKIHLSKYEIQLIECIVLNKFIGENMDAEGVVSGHPWKN